MRLRNKLFVALFLIASPAGAMTTPIVGGAKSAPGGGGTATFMALSAGTTVAWNSTVSTMQQLVSTTGTLRNLRIAVASAPTAGNSWVFALSRNNATTTITCTISDANTSCSDVTHSTDVAPGDRIALRAITNDAPVDPVNVYWNTEFSSTTPNISVLMANTAATNLSASATQYIAIQGAVAPASTETYVSAVMPTAGTLKNMYFIITGSPGSSKQYTFTVMKNGVATAITCTINGLNTACNDTTNSVSFVAGDMMDIQVGPSGTPSARVATYGLEFDPTIDGESLLLSGNGNLMTAGTNSSPQEFNMFSVTNSTWVTVSTGTRQVMLDNSVLTKFYVVLSTTPGISKFYRLQPNVNGTNTDLSVQLGTLTGNDLTHQYIATAGDLLTIGSQAVALSNTNPSYVNLGLVMFVDPNKHYRTLLGVGQ